MAARMSPVVAERWLGQKRSHKGQALLRYAMKREKEIGKRIVSRDGIGAGRRYWFTRALIRRYMPELLEDRYDRVSRKVAETVQRVTERIDDIIDDRIETHPIIDTLQKQSEETIRLVDILSSQVERLAKQKTENDNVRRRN